MAYSQQFIPLRAHSEFSISDGILRIKPFVKQAIEYGYPALGMTDLMNVFGVVKFYKACRDLGVKPIMGADVRIQNLDNPKSPYRALLLIKNEAGYLRLSELLTKAFENQHKGDLPQLQQSWLDEGDNSGLLCLSGAHLGEVGEYLLAGQTDLARVAAQKYAAWFVDSFYLELQRLPEKPEWEIAVSGSVHLAAELNLPVVATHATQFLSQDDFKAHDARVCIANGWIMSDSKRPHDFTPSQYFVSPDEMLTRFADLPEALENTVEIAKRCNLTLTLGKNFLPDFPTPDGMDLNDYLTHLANEGLRERLAILYSNEAERAQKLPEYQARLDFELNTIIQMGFSGYFLIVQDFINWAKQNGCPVGPGRGSGAGSLVAYSLHITDLDPLKYALLFERFLNPERVSMPDFDIDFCQANRGRVIEYVREKYGKDAVSQIVTFGAMSSKAVIRDVGRVLQLPFGLCDRLSKLIPVEANKPLHLKQAMEVEPEIAQVVQAEDAWELLELAEKLEDLTRNLGMHAGGVLIAPGKVSDFCPIYQADEKSSPVSMFDKGDVEDIGLVKFDFLGLRNLTIIEMAQQFIKQTTGQIIDVNHVDVNDEAAYQIFRDANTTAVFQFESDGMKKMLSQAHTTKLEEIIAFVSLYRPGPMDLIPDFIARMKGEPFEYMHPLLAPVLEPTYGIMVYQEQVMQAAQVIGGYSLGGADLLRRAMGKKKPEEMVKHREIFAEGAAKNGIDRAKADEIFDYMEKFAGYGFNKSHAAAYAYVSYQTAWLKAHHPAEFMAATMSSELDNTDQLKVFFEDAQNKFNQISFLPPDINESFYHFMPTKEKQIRYALGAIKGTGEAAIEAIVQARQTGGRFKSLFDFCERVGKGAANKRVIESLIRGGAFDSIEPNRAMLLGNVERVMSHADQAASNANQGGLFDMCDDAIEELTLDYYPEWEDNQRLAEEKQVLGIYLSGHPFAMYAAEMAQISPTTLAKIYPHEHIRLAGLLVGLRTIFTKTGKMIALQLEDLSGSQEVIIRGELVDTLPRETLQVGQILICECRIRENTFNDERSLRVQAHKISTLAQFRSEHAHSIVLQLFDSNKQNINNILNVLDKYKNDAADVNRVQILIQISQDDAQGLLALEQTIGIANNSTFLTDLTDAVQENYIIGLY